MNIINKPICVVECPIKSRSGYGDHSRDIVRSLIKYGKLDVKLAPTRWGSTPETALDADTDENKDFKSRFITSLNKQPDVHVQITIPNEFKPKGKYNIGITAGIESTLARGEWIEGVNRMDLNIVPSKHAKDVFLNTKYTKRLPNGQEQNLEVTKPIEVLFEGSNTEIYKVTNDISKSIQDSLNNIPEEFNFLFVGHWLQGGLGSDRKDIGMLIKVFLEVFKNQKKKPGLILKSSGASFSEVDKNEILKKIKSIQSLVSGDLPNVYLLHGELADEEINSLYNHPKVKAHVSFTHGEGYGRPLQEASLSEKPVICSGWSGPVDFLDRQLSILLSGKVEKIPPDAANEWIIKESGWFVVNYSEAARAMEDVYKNYQKYESNAKKLSKKNSEKFSLSAMDSEFAKLLDDNLPEFSIEKTINLPKLNKLPELKKK